MADTTAPSPDCLGKLISYVKTQKGLILVAEIIICLIIFICYAVSWYGGYIPLAICEMVFALIIFVVFMMEWDKQFLMISWLWTDFLRTAISAAVYLITSLIVVCRRFGDKAFTAGGVFGLLAGFLFAYDAYTVYLQIKAARQHTAASTDEKF